VTRGVLLDVPRFRGTDYVTQDALRPGSSSSVLVKCFM